jgi:hypothetical protein
MAQGCQDASERTEAWQQMRGLETALLLERELPKWPTILLQRYAYAPLSTPHGIIIKNIKEI